MKPKDQEITKERVLNKQPINPKFKRLEEDLYLAIAITSPIFSLFLTPSICSKPKEVIVGNLIGLLLWPMVSYFLLRRFVFRSFRILMWGVLVFLMLSQWLE